MLGLQGGDKAEWRSLASYLAMNRVGEKGEEMRKRRNEKNPAGEGSERRAFLKFIGAVPLILSSGILWGSSQALGAYAELSASPGTGGAEVQVTLGPLLVDVPDGEGG